jgi:hypothetical protein
MRANVSVGAKHSGCKSLALTNNLSTGMLRPYKIGMLPAKLRQIIQRLVSELVKF